MQRSLVFALAAACAVIGGAAGAALTVWITGGEKTPARQAASAEAAEGPADPAVLARLSGIEQRLRAMELRREVGARAAPAGSVGPSAPAHGAESGPLVDDPVFEAAVRDVLERAEEDRVGERQVRREERRRAEVDRWTQRLEERLKLNPTQKAKLSQIATDYWNRVRTLWEGDGGTPPPREARLNQAREARDQADAAIRQALDPRQAAQYDELDDEFRLGARRFGRGGGPTP